MGRHSMIWCSARCSSAAAKDGVIYDQRCERVATKQNERCA
jgi:hypothetical protein